MHLFIYLFIYLFIRWWAVQEQHWPAEEQAHVKEYRDEIAALTYKDHEDPERNGPLWDENQSNFILNSFHSFIP